jgi:uncharacterized membrane protein
MINRFPNDRVNNFSDAIFAIAITLLVLEVKIPSSEDLHSIETLGVLQKLIPSFVSLLISFFVTALYWRAHLTLAQFIRTYDNKLLWLTLWLLLFVVLLPFSTGFYAKNFGDDGPFVFYCFNLVMIGFFNLMMVRYTIRKEGFSETLTPLLAQWLLFRSRIAPVIWALSAVLVFVAPNLARFAFVTIFIIQAIGERRFKKRAPRP